MVLYKYMNEKWGAFQSPDVFKPTLERVVFLAGRLVG